MCASKPRSDTLNTVSYSCITTHYHCCRDVCVIVELGKCLGFLIMSQQKGTSLILFQRHL